MSAMGGIFESTFRPLMDGDVAGTSTAGPWFNYKGGRRAECDWVNWTAPNEMIFRVQLVVPCPACQYPHVIPVKPAPQQTVLVGDDGELSVMGLIACPGHWMMRDASGNLGGEQRCGLRFVVREGLAHDCRCQALHQPNCSMLRGGPCQCGGVWGNKQACNCGSLHR